MRLFYKLIIVLISISFFFSCNIFFSSPHGRENINDEAAQITAFTAVPLSDKSVVTMWNWKEAPSWVNDDRITEINIQHSILGYPENFVFFAGESFTDNTTWQHEWKNLTPNITHYFSLFAKSTDNDGNDIWLEPIKVKVKLPGTTETGVVFSRLDALNIDSTGGEIWNSDPLAVTNSAWAVVWFDLSEDVYIENASINISLSALTEITFTALDSFLPDDGMDKWNGLDDGSLVNEEASITYGASQPSYDISDVVRAAAIGPEKAILIKTTDGSSFTVDNNASAPYIMADIIR